MFADFSGPHIVAVRGADIVLFTAVRRCMTTPRTSAC